jgi:Acetyltransferase (GNAT) family
MNDNNIITQIAKLSDISSFFELQAKYLVTNLTEEQKKDGFVTTPFTVEQLTEIIENEGLFLAKIEEKVIGYAFAGSWAYFSQWKIIEQMGEMLPLSFNNQEITLGNSFQYGPICIDMEYRGTGLMNQLFDFMRQNMVKKYPISVTFINKINERSRKAHVEKLGWKIVKDFQFNGNTYYFLMLEM